MIESYHPKVRLFVPQPLAAGAVLTLSAAQSHYLCGVMRARPGERLLLFNGKDGEWEALLLAADRKNAALQLQQQTQPQRCGPDVWLLFAPVKFGKIDFLAQKAVELGAARLQPVRTERTIVARVNEERLHANALEAAEQSERLDVPEIGGYQSLESLLGNWPGDRPLLYGDETGRGAPPVALFGALKAEKRDKIALLTGPEGGFSARELERLRVLPYARAMSLGPRILRADTAALAALACAMALWGDWR